MKPHGLEFAFLRVDLKIFVRVEEGKRRGEGENKSCYSFLKHKPFPSCCITNEKPVEYNDQMSRSFCFPLGVFLMLFVHLPLFF